jgi:hypothetical protein
MYRNVPSILVAVRVAVSCLLIFLFAAGSARSQTDRNSYSLLVASGFLCDPGESGGCHAIVKSASGDSYEISGAGTFSPQNKSVKAAGTFNHKSTKGNMLETGVWIASDLISFSSYGSAPAALLPKGPAFGTAHVGPRFSSMPSGPTPTGGLAAMRILMIPVSGTNQTALLEVNCALGDVPRERSTEGIRLTVERNGTEFSEEASGRVMFLSTWFEVRMQPNPRERKITLPTSQLQNN